MVQNYIHIYIYLYIFLLCLKYSKSIDCSTYAYSSGSSSCSDNTFCKPKYSKYNSITCHYCSSQSSYYTIKENGECLINECIGDKIIYETKECTFRELDISTTFFKMGDFYYYNLPDSSSLYSCVDRICSCKEYYYIELLYGKRLIHCLSNPTNTYKFYSHKTKEIFTECPNDLKYMKLEALSSYTRCSDSCEISEWNIAITDDYNNIKEYCVDNCEDNHSPDRNYKYEYINNGVKSCLKECPIGTYKREESTLKPACLNQEQCDFYDRIDLSCYSNCAGNSRKYHNFGSKECIGECTGEYLYADDDEYICYRKQDCNFIDENNTNKKLCLKQCSDNNPYHDNDSKSCIKSCGENKRYHADGKFVCYSSCKDIPDGDYKFESKDEPISIPRICYTEPLPSDSDCEFYYRKVDGIFKCTTKSDCIQNLQNKYFLGSECRDNCDGYYQIELEYLDSGTNPLNYIQCYESFDAALKDTNNVKYCDKSQKKCWKEFPTDDTYYIKPKYPNSQLQYEIVRECPYFYYLNLDSSKGPLNKNICIDNCKTTSSNQFFQRGNKKCLNSCTEVHLYYYDEQNYECLESCELRPGKPFSNPISVYPTNCLSSCDSSRRYYNYDSHICLFSCDDNNNNYLYHKFTDNDDKYICYPSCLDIPSQNGEIYKYASFSDNSCHITEPTDGYCQYYYTLKDGVKKCATLVECYKNKYLFLHNQECKIKCDDDYYKLEKIFTITLNGISTDITFTKCYPSPNDCLILENQESSSITKIFYNKELRICYTFYPSNYYIKLIDSNKYELVQACEYFYYTKKEEPQKDYKFCTENCMIAGTEENPLFFESGNKLCDDTCINFNKYYYDPNNNECLDTCTRKTNMKYALPIEFPNKPQKCLIKCPNDNPFFITNGNKLECVDRCPYNNYIYLDIKTNECLLNCNDNLQININNICYPKCQVDENILYINTDTYECVTACPIELKNTVKLYSVDSKNVYLCVSLCNKDEFRLGDECLEKCPLDHRFIGYNNICKEKCAEDANGEYYYPINKLEVSNPDDYIYRCVSSCNDAKITKADGTIINYDFYEKSKPYECLDSCPSSSIFYLNSNEKECLSSCPYNFPFYKAQDNNYECQSTTFCLNNQYFNDGYCVDLNKCLEENKKYVDSRNICLNECPEKDLREKIEYFQEAYKCLRNCGDKFIINHNNYDQPECVEYCPKEMNYIGQDRICKSHCEESDGIYYYKVEDKTITYIDSLITYTIYKCVDGCKADNEGGHPYRVINNGNQCYFTCPNEYPYLSLEENLCYDNCLKSEINPFTLEDEKKCAKACNPNTGKIFWGDDKICLSSCDELGSANIVDYNKKCVEKCDITSSYPFELDKECVYSCDLTKKRYSIDDYKCKDKCRLEDEFVTYDNQCTKTCNKFINYINGEKECIDTCPENKKLHYPDNKICKEKCNPGDKIVEDLDICVSNCNELTDLEYFLYKSEQNGEETEYCVLNCPEKKSFINNKECVSACPIQNNRYYVKSDLYPKKYCYNDCPEHYPYYTIITDDDNPSDKKYPCEATCNGYFVPNSNPLIKAKQCLISCPDNIYTQYQYKIEVDNEKRCYIECPHEAKYHFNFPTSGDNNCYEKCPEEKNAPYHEKGESICLKLSELNGGYLLYDIREWTYSLIKCPDEYPLQVNKEDNIYGITICLKECNFKYLDELNNVIYNYSYLTYDNTCVTDCTSSTSVQEKFLKNDNSNKKCICLNYFYIDDSFKTRCYSNDIQHCKDTPNQYFLPLIGTKQCLKACDDGKILSPSEDECYERSTPCSVIESKPNTTELIITKNGQKKCDCKYKFYFSNDKKICLQEDGNCPHDKNLLILDTKECVNICPNNYPLRFQNFCLKDACPTGSNRVDNICKCEDKFWYQSPTGYLECLEGNCLQDYPVYIYNTKQCLKTCKGSSYKYLYDNACYDSCTFIPNSDELEIDSPLAEFKCGCKRPWYYNITNNNIMYCPPNNDKINKCRDYTDLDLPFMIYSTNQCVKTCPMNYSYYFNNICFTSCEYANKVLRSNIEPVDTSYECKCQNLWYIDPEDKYKTDKKCYEKNKNECPPYYGANENEISTKSTSYLIFSTNQCVNNKEQCPLNSYKFNSICYDRCPEFTLESNGPDKTCICNKEKYLWLEYEKYGNIYYECGLNSCPEEFINGQEKYIRLNLLESENKCVRSCKNGGSENNKYRYIFRNRCVLECPKLTFVDSENEEECEFYDLNDQVIDNLEKLKEATNIQAKELYNKSDHLSGFLLNKFDASLQIYSTDKFNTYKELSMKSNLTYIDLGTCRDKIYADYNLDDNDKILIAKYDLLKRMKNSDSDNEDEVSKDNKFLINQVEYEFYLERTMEKIEGSICSPYEIIISYPIFFNKNKFNNFEDGINNNNYLKQFKIGKELNEKNPEIDTFNKDNKIYKDICLGLELDGKDLVLEERYSNLYPNNISLCESNCTMNNTDFTLERINCLCSYKEVFDFYRIDEDNNDILNNPNFIKPTQSKSNIEIMKCLSKIDIKEGLLKNEAFYASSVITIVEIISVVVTAIKGIKTISSFAKGLLNMKGIIGNPPKKGDNNNENNDNDLIEIKKRNIINKKKIIIMNNSPVKINSKNSVSELMSKNNDNLNNEDYYFDNIGQQHLPTIKINDKNNSIHPKFYNKNSLSPKKADFIPPKYNFKFFKPNDKGIVKRIKRSQLPFKISSNVKLLLEAKEGVNYDKNYLKGPYYEEQNIIEIIEENNIKYDDEDLNDGSNIVINKNYYKNNGMFKEEIYKANKGEKDFINITKKNPINNLDMSIILYKQEKDKEKKLYSIISLYTLMKREHTYLRADYKSYITKSHPNILATILAEILDKIYFIKIFIFLKKFEITSIHLSLYLFYHILLLSLLCGFFTINTIKRIWKEDNFPNMKFYLLYGLITHIIVWIIYKIFIFLLDNQDQFMKLSILNNENKSNNILRDNTNKYNNDIDNEEYNNKLQKNIEEKYEEIIKKIKIQTIIFYIIIILFTEFCSAYLISFFAIYTGTKKYILKTYYISIIEIIIIKFVYGLSLASLRIAAEVNEYKTLYNFVYTCDKYLS